MVFLNLKVLIDKGKEDPTLYFADQLKVKYDPIRKPFFFFRYTALYFCIDNANLEVKYMYTKKILPLIKRIES